MKMLCWEISKVSSWAQGVYLTSAGFLEVINA